MLESSQQNSVLSPCVSGCMPTPFARLMVSAEGPDWSVAAGVLLAVGAAAGAVAGASEAGALAAEGLAAEAGVESEDCCAEHGSTADRTAHIKIEEVENFTMLPSMFDRKKPSGTNAAGNSRPQFLLLYAYDFVSRNATASPARISRRLSFRKALD